MAISGTAGSGFPYGGDFIWVNRMSEEVVAGCLLTLVEGSNIVKPKGPERVLNTLFMFLHDVQELLCCY